jgi:hypothetical protein
LVNARSIKNKELELLQTINDTDPHIICITETWIDETIDPKEFLPADYDYHVRDRNSNGGGVLIAVKNSISHRALEVPDAGIESCWCEVTVEGKEYVIACIYRPHSSDENCIPGISTQLQHLAMNRSTKLILAGDFNFPELKWNEDGTWTEEACNKNHDALFDFMLEHGLHQNVYQVTRYSSTPSTLDLVFTNYNISLTNVYTTQGISDHEIVGVEWLGSPKTVICKRRVPVYRLANWDALRNELQSSYAAFADGYTDDVNQNWEKFVEIIVTLTEKHIPTKLVKNSDKLWITPKLKNRLRKQRRLAKEAKQGIDVDKYLNFKQDTLAKLINAKETFMNSLVTRGKKPLQIFLEVHEQRQK